MKVLHGVLEDVGVEMSGAGDVCGGTERCFLTPEAWGEKKNYILHLIYRADYLTRLFWCESDISKLWGRVPSLSHQKNDVLLVL